MFYEQIGEYTRGHLSTHLPAYLTAQQALYTDKLPLIFPKHIDVASIVGGIVQVARETLPQYAIDIVNKQLGTGFEDLYTYDYPGQITALVGGGSAHEVDVLIKRHAAMIEKFSKEHEFLHQHSDSDGFTLLGWRWDATMFSGAMQLERADSPVGELWAAAAQLDFTWVTSEAGPS